MGIVKISDRMHESLRVVGNALSRSINAQAEHWLRLGMLAELHPELRHPEVCQLLIRIEQAGGFDLASATALATAFTAPPPVAPPSSKTRKRSQP